MKSKHQNINSQQKECLTFNEKMHYYYYFIILLLFLLSSPSPLVYILAASHDTNHGILQIQI